MLDEELEEYCRHLMTAEQKAQEDYDKTVLTLSGGALGVSFAFIDKIIKDRPIGSAHLLFAAWLCWSVSVLVVLASYFFSIRALRVAQKQARTGAIYSRPPGGTAARLTEIANLGGALLFIGGLVVFGIFVARNIL